MSADHHDIARGLLNQIGHDAEFTLNPLPGGRNNRVWRIRAGDVDFLLKQYYWAEADQRDRMGHEWDFLSYLHGIGCTRAPRAFAADRDNRCALLEFIEGTHLKLPEIGEKEIQSAADFFSEINAARFSAGELPPASEACFSLEEHVQTMERRVRRLSQISPEEDLHQAAIAFASEGLVPLWERVCARIEQMAPEAGGMRRPLELRERCLSPSDFGFHNSLRIPGGGLRFLDFEYAGWDDPAKTIADFANQPDMLLDSMLSEIFTARALALFDDGGTLAARLRLLTPLYQIKWACICMNEFLPSGTVRRAFTGLKSDEGLTRLAGHLERAHIMAGRARESLDFPPSPHNLGALSRPSP